MRRTRIRLPRGAAGLAGAALAAVLLAACGAGEQPGVAQHGAVAVAANATQNEPVGTPAPAPTLQITPGDGTGNVALDQAVKVTADTGQIDSVVLKPLAGGTALQGQLGSHSRTWQYTGPLDPKTRYVVQATAHDSGGSSTAQASFTTLAVGGRLTTDVQPYDGSTVGVGMPIILSFNAPVAKDKQANLVAHIQVQTSTPLDGAWHWFSDTEVHWRPADLWPSGTQVTVVANLKGVPAGNDVWGLGNWTDSFTIGAKHYSVIDAASHQMQVFENDALIHTYPVSTGVDNVWPTISGTLYVRYKFQKVHMVSTSIGIPVNAPGGYDEDVFWDTAISTDGFFVHAAPWSVWAQGSQNVSHGCVNLSTQRATEFFNFSQPGDVVVVKNTKRVADESDGEGDWQIPFAQFANSGGASSPASTQPASAPGGAGGI